MIGSSVFARTLWKLPSTSLILAAQGNLENSMQINTTTTLVVVIFMVLKTNQDQSSVAFWLRHKVNVIRSSVYSILPP